MRVESAAETASIVTANNSANWTDRRALRERNGRMRSIVRHRHCRGRAQADLEAEAVLRGSDRLLELTARGAQIGVPEGEPRGRVRHIRERSHAARIGARRPCAVRNDDEGAPLVVDVAAQCNDAGLVEM